MQPRFVIARRRSRRGNLGKAVTISPGMPCYPTIFCEIPRRVAPRNDKLGSLAPMNLCRDHCRPAWRSLSAATDAIGFYVFIGGLYESTVQRREGHVPPLQRPAGGRAEKFPGACAPGNGSFQSRTFVSISARHFVRKSSTLMAPRSTPARVRTDTVWFSMSRSPTTSIYGIFCIWASRIL